MISQHCREIYIIVASFTPEYIRYLDGTSLDNDTFERKFLLLSLYGPFNIFIAEDMGLFGSIVVILSLQQEFDRRDQKKDQTKPAS